MTAVTREELAAALRTIAGTILGVAAQFDPVSEEAQFLVTETGQRLRVIEYPATYLAVEPETPPAEG